MKSSLPDAPPPALDRALDRVRPRLGRLATRVHAFATIGSTNDVAATLPEGAVVVADHQTAGRGRRGHSWFSPAGSGLYVSVVLEPWRAARDPARATGILTLAAGVALAEAVQSSAGLSVELKWPNDLFVGGRKLGGILAEGHTAGQRVERVVLGYGINLLDTAFPPELRERATSIEGETRRRIDRYDLLADTLASLSARYDDLLAARFDAILDAWRARAPRSDGAAVRWSSAAGARIGTTRGIDDRGALLVEVEGRIERVVSGIVDWL